MVFLLIPTRKDAICARGRPKKGKKKKAVKQTKVGKPCKTKSICRGRVPSPRDAIKKEKKKTSVNPPLSERGATLGAQAQKEEGRKIQ